MPQITFHGDPVQVNGSLPSTAPEFKLVDKDLGDRTLATCDCASKRKVLNIFPSVDTGVCAASVRRFNELASQMDNAEVLCISADLPFAQGRFCGAEGLDNVTMLSMMSSREFLQDYGVAIADGPLAGVAARAVIVLDIDDKVLHAQLVSEIGAVPDYKAALKVLN